MRESKIISIIKLISINLKYFTNLYRKCPFCNLEFNKKDIKLDEELQIKINSAKKLCECKKKIPITQWEKHISECSPYQSEINKNIQNTIVKDVKM